MITQIMFGKPWHGPPDVHFTTLNPTPTHPALRTVTRGLWHSKEMALLTQISTATSDDIPNSQCRRRLRPVKKVGNSMVQYTKCQCLLARIEAPLGGFFSVPP